MLRIVLSSTHALPGGSWADGEYQVNLNGIECDPDKKWCVAVESLELSVNSAILPLVVTAPSLQLGNTYGSSAALNMSALHVASTESFYRDVTTYSVCAEMSCPMSSWPGRIRIKLLDRTGEPIAASVGPSWIMTLAIFQSQS